MTPSSVFFFFFFLFAYRMVRGYEKVSTNQAGCQNGTPRETPTTSSLVAAMSIEELRLYSHVPVEINLEILNDPVALTIEEVDNAIYLTREKFDVGLRFPIPSLVKQFLHFTWAPPALVHLNVFRIVMSCSVLNSLYQLGISLVEICFIYTLKLGIKGRLFMLA